MSKLYFLSLVILLLFQSVISLAQNEADSAETLNDTELSSPPKSQEKETASTPAKKTGPGNVLDFEGEVIEGERRRPDLFLQMSIDNVKFDSLIYQRDDFNDYLDVDRKSRTRYLKLK